MELINILTYISGLCVIFVLCRIFILPLKFLGKLFLNSFIGIILLLLINLVRWTILFPYWSKLFHNNICKHLRNPWKCYTYAYYTSSYITVKCKSKFHF
ncbi:MAG: hypothetical protein HFJ23_01910 [Clostridia bacterium]|nr:hypothetical protein [Clostridia bacterium]